MAICDSMAEGESLAEKQQSSSGVHPPAANLDLALRVSTRVEIARLHRVLRVTMDRDRGLSTLA
jgi:hypothetical protein